MKFQLIATIIAGAFATSALAAPSADPDLAVRGDPKEDNVPAVDAKSAESLEFLLDEILAIPDDILLKGDKATHTWLAEHPLNDPDLVIEKALSQRDVDDEEEDAALERRFGLPKALKCALAIVKVFAGNAIPASKIIRIKKLIKALGGVKKAVKLLLKAKTKAQMIKLGGKGLWELYKEVSGVNAIKKACFK